MESTEKNTQDLTSSMPIHSVDSNRSSTAYNCHCAVVAGTKHLYVFTNSRRQSATSVKRPAIWDVSAEAILNQLDPIVTLL